MERLRAVTALPLAAGFGIARREHLDALRGHADAAVVGSALVRVIEEHGAGPEGRRRLAQAVREILHGHQ
jgi:tryptophan synthase alpha chain